MNRERTFWYTLARGIAAFIYPVIFRAKAKGVENFVADENCILLGNHISGWDPITMAKYYTHNEVHYIAKESLFRHRSLAWLLRKLHAFPVKRGETDMAAMRTSMQVLKDGHVLGIFPEGTRKKDGGERSIETGVAVIAIKNSVPVTPVFIGGAYRLFGRLRVVVGKPIPLNDLRAQHQDAKALEEVKRRILVALDELEAQADF